MRAVHADTTGEWDPAESIPWLSIILLAVFIFLADHNLQAPIEFRSATDTTMAAIALIREGSTKRQITYTCLGLFGAIAFLFRPRWRLSIRGLFPWVVLVFLGLAFLSVAWSDDRGLTIRRLGVLAFICVGVCGVLRHFSRLQIVMLITFANVAYLIVGFGNELFLGTFRPFAAGYRFAGTVHPVVQSIDCAILLLGALCLVDRMREHRRLLFGCLAFGALFLFFTRSRTGTAAALVAAFVYWYLTAHRYRLRAMTTVLLLGAALLIALMLILNQVIPMPWDVVLMGRGTTNAASLTGRIPLWDLLFSSAMQRPMLGYGFDSFMSPRHAAQVAAILAFGLNSAHSVYLDVLLGVGFIGLALFLAVMGLSIVRAVRSYRIVRDPVLAFFAALIVFELFSGTLDSTLIFPNPRFWTLLVIGYLAFRDPLEESHEYRIEPTQGARGDPMTEWMPAEQGAYPALR